MTHHTLAAPCPDPGVSPPSPSHFHSMLLSLSRACAPCRGTAAAILLLSSTLLAEDTVTRLAPVVVTASPSERPLTVTLDPRAAAQPLPAQDGAEALRAVPGFTTIRKGGTDGDPVFRGMAGSRLGVLLDGENILGGCGMRMDPPTAYVFPSTFDQITVLKGPQSVLHGPGNSAGVVLFERLPPRYLARTMGADSAFTAGAWGRNDQFIDLRAGAPAGYVHAIGSRTAADDYEDGAGQKVASRYERWSTHLATGWTPDTETQIELTGTVSDGEVAYADRMMDGVKFARRNVGLRARRMELTPLIERVEASLFFNDVDHVMDNFSLRPFSPSAMMPAPAVSNPDRRTFGGRALATLRPAEKLRLTAGADYQGNRHRLRSSSNETLDPYGAKPRVADASFDTGGVFAEATYARSAAERWVAGARVDAWTAQDRRHVLASGMMSAPNPTADTRRRSLLPSGFLRYERDLSPSTTGYAGVGHVQRFPDYWELFSKESATTRSAFRTRAEKTTQVDVGLTHRTGAFTSSVSFFANRVTDFILIESNVEKPGAMGTLRRVTIARNVDAAAFGGEASATWAFAPGWKLDASLAGVHGTNRTDDRPLAQQPPLEGRIGLNYATPVWSFGGVARLVDAQSRFARNQGNIVGQDLGPTAGFAVFSLNAGYKPHARAQLSAGIDNLLDKTYAEHLSRGGSMVAGFPPPTLRVREPGRTWWAKLQLSF
jgi:iron complex outermembrane receptor protein